MQRRKAGNAGRCEQLLVFRAGFTRELDERDMRHLLSKRCIFRRHVTARSTPRCKPIDDAQPAGVGAVHQDVPELALAADNLVNGTAGGPRASR